MVILIIRGCEKVILINGGRKNVIWARDQKKVYEAGRGSVLGTVGQGK